MNRSFLTAWSLGLSDVEFAQALAGAGLPAKLARDQHTSLIEWRLDDRNTAKLAAPALLIARWQAFESATRYRRRFLVYEASHELAAMFANALGLLPNVAAVSVNVDAWASSRLDWKLPFTVMAQKKDSVTPRLEALPYLERPNWPFRFVTASREEDRCEIFVLSQPLPEALAAVLSSSHRVRAALVVVAGWGAESAASAWPMLMALAARLSAVGVAVAPTATDAESFAQQVNRFAFELTHNEPIDVALTRAFGHEIFLLATPMLLQSTQLEAQIPKIGQILSGLPKARSIRLSDRSSDLLFRGASPYSAAAPAARGVASDGRGVLANAEDIRSALASTRSYYVFARESGEATDLTEIAKAARDAVASDVASRPSGRRVQQKSWRKQRGRMIAINDGYIVAEPVLMRVKIDHLEDATWTAASKDFPDQRLPPSKHGHRLQIVLHEPRQFDEPQVRLLHLPSAGSSEEVEFHFTPKRIGTFEARITVAHRNRVLQTLLLRGRVYKSRDAVPPNATALSLDVETRVRHDWSDLNRRRRFDLALVCNHGHDAVPRITALANTVAWAKDLKNVDAIVDDINSLLSAVANNVIDYEDGLDKGDNPRLLVALARNGFELFNTIIFDQLSEGAAGSLDLRSDQVSHIQIISAHKDAIVPIEFVYDRGAPDDQLPPSVCPEHRVALKTGECKRTCPGMIDPSKHVCPMGFWGIRKVIERHMAIEIPDNLPKAELVLQNEPSAARERIEIRNAAVVGFSSRVPANSLKPLVAVLKSKISGNVQQAANWDAWAGDIAAHQPRLLVAFPHNDGVGRAAKLEIGNSKLDTLGLWKYGESTTTPGGLPRLVHVRTQNAAPPIALLLGCDVAGTASDYSSHVASFRRGGAAVVVSTIASVFGEHAVKVGTLIVEGLLQSPPLANTSGSDRIGEALRDAKRKALLQSLPMALCVVAFGDADWKL